MSPGLHALAGTPALVTTLLPLVPLVPALPAGPAGPAWFQFSDE